MRQPDPSQTTDKDRDSGSAETLTPARAVRRRPFDDKRLISGAVGLSAGGDFLAVIPLASIVSASTGSSLAVVALFAALWAPSVLLAPLAGRLVDGFENSRLLVCVSSLQAVAALAMIPAGDSIVAITVIAGLLGSGHAVAQAAEFALVPAIAEGAELQRLNGRVETARYLGMSVGPITGGLLAAAGGVVVALAGNALTFVAVALAAYHLRARRSPDPGRGLDRSGSRTPNSLTLLFGREPLRLAMIVAAASLVLMTTVWAALPFFARQLPGGEEVGYGALMSAWTLGMAFGANLLAHRVPARLLAGGAMTATVVQGAGLALPTIWLWLPLACGFFVISGIGHGVKNVLLRTLIQEQLRPDSHGQAAAAYNALRNGAELIALAGGGALVALIGARTTLSLSGALPVIVAGVGLLVLAARRIPASAAPEAGAEAPLTAA